MGGQTKGVKKSQFGQKGGKKSHFGDRESAMRHMKFQGQQNRGKAKKTGNKSLNTGWAHKEAKVYDEK